jgi:hypothetical protein
MTVGELLARVSAAELTDWMAYERISGPLGAGRADLQAGIIAATVANVNRAKGKRAYRPDEFIPRFDRPRATTPQQMANFLKALTLRLGGRIRKGGATK